MSERGVLRCLSDADISPEVRRIFALRLSFVLERRGITQRQLSNATGISPSSISRLVSGQRTVTGDALARICLALGVDASWLLGLPARNPARPTGAGAKHVQNDRSKRS